MVSLREYQQSLNKEERRLHAILSKLYRNIKHAMSLKPSSGYVSWTDIQRLYRPQAHDAIRAAVTALYEIEARKTVERDINVPFYLTGTDMKEITELARRYEDWFFTGLEREIVKKTAHAFDPVTLMRLDPSDLELKDTFLGRMTDSIQAEVTAHAVISKSRQILGPVVPITPRSPSAFRYASIYDEYHRSPRVRWNTEKDERVCFTCAKYQGFTWGINESWIPIPIEDSHPRCRCKLSLIGSLTSTEPTTPTEQWQQNVEGSAIAVSPTGNPQDQGFGDMVYLLPALAGTPLGIALEEQFEEDPEQERRLQELEERERDIERRRRQLSE